MYSIISLRAWEISAISGLRGYVAPQKHSGAARATWNPQCARNGCSESISKPLCAQKVALKPLWSHCALEMAALKLPQSHCKLELAMLPLQSHFEACVCLLWLLQSHKPLRSHCASKRIAPKPLCQLFGPDITASSTAKPLRAWCSSGDNRSFAT